MSRALVFVATMLVALLAGGIAVAEHRDDVAFTQITDDFVVQADGVIVGVYDDAGAAADAAAHLKTTDPGATVLYGHRSMMRADVVDDRDTPDTEGSTTTDVPDSPEEATKTQRGTTPPSPSPTVSGTPPTNGPADTIPGDMASPPTVPTTVTPAPPPRQPGPVSPTALVWGYDATPLSASWTQPDLGASYTDPAYGTSVRRMTSADGTRFDRNTYSRRQAENADGSHFMTYHGDAAYHVYDRSTLELVRRLDIHPDGEPQWHPTNPDLVRSVAGPNSYVGDLRLYETSVSAGTTQVIADLTSRVQAQLPTAAYMIDRAEGSPSMDGNRYAWLIHDAAEDIIGIVSYDLATDTILGINTELLHDESELDWVSMSPSGRHVLAGYWDGTYAYDAQLSGPTRLTLTGEHSDIAINGAGNDAYVYIDFSAGPNGGWLVSTDLETGEETRIFDLYDDANTSIHISGKGYARPGWVVASTYSCKEPFAWSCHKVMAVELVENGRVLNLAHTYNCGENYWTETHATVNRDFSRVYFNTDSGSCGMDAEVMEIAVPPFN